MNPRLAVDFDRVTTLASKSALLELSRALKHYHDALVLVGGWVPYLLIEGHLRHGNPFVHVGSIDVDFVVDPGEIGEDEYRTIVRTIQDIGWVAVDGSRFSFQREVITPNGGVRKIKVDFLTLPAEGVGKKHRHRPIQSDLQARTMRGAELALTHRAPRKLSGVLPGGAESSIEFLMLDAVGCLGTKGIALGERFKQKDAYDIVSVLDDYGGGVREVASLVKAYIQEPLIAESMKTIAEKFQSPRSEGPVWYAEFLGGESATQERARQRAFQLVGEFDRLLV